MTSTEGQVWSELFGATCELGKTEQSKPTKNNLTIKIDTGPHLQFLPCIQFVAAEMKLIKVVLLI